MTREEAKHILSVYREDIPVGQAPEVARALALLETDEILRTWLENERRFDEKFASALKEITVPTGLAQHILEKAGDDLSDAQQADVKVISFPRPRLWLAAAAAAVVITAGSLVKYYLYPPAVQFPGSRFASVEEFRSDMAHYANSRFVLGRNTSDFAKARDWLRKRQSPTYDETPAAIVHFKGMGCQSFRWGENRVSLVCFQNDDGEIVHLFVVSKEVFDTLVPADELKAIQVRHHLETGGWMHQGNLYLLVGSEPEVRIGELFALVGEA